MPPPPPPPIPISATNALHYDAAHAVHVVRYGSRDPGKERGNVTATGDRPMKITTTTVRIGVFTGVARHSLATPASIFDYYYIIIINFESRL